MNSTFQRLKTSIERYPVIALAVILIVGLLPRAVMLPKAGFPLDLEQHYFWGKCAGEFGFFGLYQCTPIVTHPPISPALLGIAVWLLQALGGDISTFGNNPAMIAMLKLPNLIFEIGIICLVFYIVYKKAGVWWAAVVAALLNFNLGWIVVTSWWGQNDPSYSFFMVLTAYLLIQNRARWMWIAYALAWLAKFQSIMFLPVLLVLAYRRFGLRSTLEGLALYVFIVVAGVVPFVLGSGPAALRPFIGTVNLFPYITNGAYNMWFWVSGSSQMVILDSAPFVGSVTYLQAGLLLLCVGEALLCLRAWVQPQGEEYLLLAAANLTFFMLPTQIQARYLYPGLIFLALAMAGNWKLIALYIGLSITFTYNVLKIVWLGVGILFYPAHLMIWTPTINALAVTLMYIIFMWIVLQPLSPFVRRFAIARTEMPGQETP